MPYKNIVFVKLLWKELLHEDDRFIEKCNDEQKGLYLMLLLLAGATNNNIPESENYLKRTLNLSESPENIVKNRDFLLSIFPKLIRNNGFLKFKNFKGLHNYIGKSQLKEISDEMGFARIDKNRIDKIRVEFAHLKNHSLKEFSRDDYARTGKAIKKLLMRAEGNEDLVIQGLKWANSQGWCD